MKLILTLFLTLSVLPQSFSQKKSTHTFTVMDGENNVPIHGAIVRVTGSSSVISTEADGTFSVNLKRKDRELIIAHVSYHRIRIDPQMHTGSEITMNPRVYRLPWIDLSELSGLEKSDQSDLIPNQDGGTMATHPNGEHGFRKDLAEKLSKNTGLIEAKIRLKVEFYVSESGKIVDVTSPSDTSAYFDLVVSALSESKTWTPASASNIPWRQKFSIGFYNKSEEIFTPVEKPAMPDGGYAAFYQFIQSNLQYPEEAQKKSIEGKVFVSFVVTEDGSLQEIDVFRGIGYGCDIEAIRLMMSVPKWNPPMQRGVPVKQRIVLPITFKLD